MEKVSLTKKYQKKIDWKAHSNELCLATSSAIWLIVERKLKLTTAITLAAKKNGVPKAPLGRIIKECIPAKFFSDRRAANMSPELKQSIRNKKIQLSEDRKRIAAL